MLLDADLLTTTLKSLSRSGKRHALTERICQLSWQILFCAAALHCRLSTPHYPLKLFGYTAAYQHLRL